MRLTTKGRYAVTAMLDLAINADQGPVSLADISERQAISISYLEQLFGKLRRHELPQERLHEQHVRKVKLPRLCRPAVSRMRHGQLRRLRPSHPP